MPRKKKAKTSPRLLNTAERRAFVLNLRRTGATYDQIAQMAIQQFGADRLPRGWDSLYASKDVMRALEFWNREIKEGVDEIRTLELQRLDAMFVQMYRQALQGVVGAVDRCLKIMERRDKLLGLSLPEKLEVTGEGGAPLLKEVVIIHSSEEPDGDGADGRGS